MTGDNQCRNRYGRACDLMIQTQLPIRPSSGSSGGRGEYQQKSNHRIQCSNQEREKKSLYIPRAGTVTAVKREGNGRGRPGQVWGESVVEESRVEREANSVGFGGSAAAGKRGLGSGRWNRCGGPGDVTASVE